MSTRRLPEYHPRLADRRLTELMAAFPAVLINGPRAVGKTTTARHAAVDVVRLDEPTRAAAFRADPDAALRTRREPLLLDEWQAVPEVLGAVRRAVDDDPRPGRFVLTGSVRGEFEHGVWPGTGRIIRLSMHGMTERELAGTFGRPGSAGFLDRMELGDPAAFVLPSTRPGLPEYVERAVRGGFPDVSIVSRSADDRHTWLDSYLEQLITRDSVSTDPRRDLRKLGRYFEVLALNSAGSPKGQTLYAAAGINAKTASAYDALLAGLFVAETVPAWAPQRLARLVQAGKRYIVDAGLAASAAGVTTAAILNDGDLLGRMLDTFAMSQLRVEVALSPQRRRLHHLRTKEGRQEVDVVVELADGRVLALEFKASAAPSRRDARHLVWLRDQLGDRFVAGAVMHTGPDIFNLDDRIVAVPFCALWG